MKKIKIGPLIVFVALAELAGVIGSVFTTPSIPTWYASLIKPSFQPPAWVFGPVWTILFALMGIAAYLVYVKGGEKLWTKPKKVALTIFSGQLVLNILWSVIFFGWHNPGLAFIEIVVLWLAIVATIFAFAKVSKPAAWLLAPYLLWVTFASVLNFAIFWLN